VFDAVVFDLWQTLAVFPEEKSAELRQAWSEKLGIPAERLAESWLDGDFYRLREAGPIADAIAALYGRLGVAGEVDDILTRRLELTREALVPTDGALPTLRELRRRGIRTGLISNCTEEVPLVWDETPFAGLFDAALFSATSGLLKPDPRIYERACDHLGVEPGRCLFVGDGANDELRGAERVGMTAVLVHPEGQDPVWDGLRDWGGPRITAIPQVLELVQ
jgi:putative hydrolase of the HAD superfamily